MFDQVLGGERRRHRVERRQQRRVGLRRRGVHRRDDVVGVLQVLVVLEDDELVAGDRGAGLAGGLRLLAVGAPAGAGGAGLTAGRGEQHREGERSDESGTRAHAARLLCPVAAVPPRVSGREDSRGAHATPLVACTQSIVRTRCASVTCAPDLRAGRRRRWVPASATLRDRAARNGSRRGPGVTRPRHEHQQQFGEQREAGDEEGAGDHQPVVLLPEAEGDQPAEPSAADERGQAGGGDHLHGRRPDAGHDQRQRQREVDPRDDLAAGACPSPWPPPGRRRRPRGSRRRCWSGSAGWRRRPARSWSPRCRSRSS